MLEVRGNPAPHLSGVTPPLAWGVVNTAAMGAWIEECLGYMSVSRSSTATFCWASSVRRRSTF